MANMIPLIKSGGFFASRYWTPLVIGNGLTTTGGDTPDPPVQKTVSGSLIHITDALAAPAVALSVEINPAQSGSGDPSPTNVRPITGWTGANIVVSPTQDAQDGTTYTVSFGNNLFDQANATVYTRYFNSSDKWANSSESRSYAIPAMPGVQFTVSANNENITIFRVGYIKDQIPTSTSTSPQLYDVTRLTESGSVTITPSSDATYIIVQVNATFIAESKIQVEYGSTATEYRPYSTIYVGTLNVLTGTLTILGEKTRLLSSWTWYRDQVNSQYFFNTTSLKTSLTTYKNLSACDTFKVVGNMSAIPNPAPADATIINAYSRYYPLNIRCDAITSVEDFKTFLANNEVYVVLQRNAPTTVQLTPTEVQLFLGENNIWADTGDSTLTYLADGNVSASSALNMLLGGTYTPSADVSDREALNIIMGDTT